MRIREPEDHTLIGLIGLILLLAVTLAAIRVTDTGGGSGMPVALRTVELGAQPTHTTLVVEVVVPEGFAERVVLDGPADVDVDAIRGTQIPATPTLPPPASTPPATVPSAIPGDCAAWRPIFAWYGATSEEINFFIPRIIERETGCGRDTLNEATGDSGICQINPVHTRAGWWWGEYRDTGWLADFGLHTRVDTDNPLWAAACIHLYRKEGSSPWRATR